jgi:hypothetical protein
MNGKYESVVPRIVGMFFMSPKESKCNKGLLIVTQLR